MGINLFKVEGLLGVVILSIIVLNVIFIDLFDVCVFLEMFFNEGVDEVFFTF